MSDLGRMLVGFGVLLVIVGVILMLAGNWTFYFPLATSLLLSLLLTLVFSFLNRR